ncbi:hypothetical protein GF337_12720 [candidate division KSB1 bacterium]|nr:hypothetical protein [candidate division KSB1 bacterium]
MKFRFRINKEKRACDVALAVMLILIYFILGAIKVSPTRYIFKTPPQEIDWTLFKPKAPKTNFDNQRKHGAVADKSKGVETDNIIIPSLDFLNETSRKLKLGGQKYKALEVPAVNETGNEISIANTDQIASLSELNFNSKYTRFARQVLSSGQQIEGPSIEIENGPNVLMDVYSNKFGGIEISDGIPDDKAIPEEQIVEIELRKEEIMDDEQDISPLINELILWMKDHQTPFSSVMKRFMLHEPGNLTSKVKFSINNKVYDLYLLCKENILEVRICLVHKDKSILLIDSGFKETSNYLRKGEVRKDRNNRIVTFITRQETPSKAATTEFYQIFLSWWDTIKSKDGNGDYAR